MNFSLVKRSFRIAGDRVDVSIEDVFWTGLDDIAGAWATTPTQLIAKIEAGRNGVNLASAIRVYVLGYFLMQAKSLDDQDKAPDRTAHAAASAPLFRARRQRWLN
jgi:predicted DNA-binding ribbon-helix-helix protein